MVRQRTGLKQMDTGVARRSLYRLLAETWLVSHPAHFAALSTSSSKLCRSSKLCQAHFHLVEHILGACSQLFGAHKLSWCMSCCHSLYCVGHGACVCGVAGGRVSPGGCCWQFSYAAACSQGQKGVFGRLATNGHGRCQN